MTKDEELIDTGTSLAPTSPVQIRV